MQLDLIIARLRLKCPAFSERVAGAAEFSAIPEGAKLPVPAAYVIPLDDSADKRASSHDGYQEITDNFAIILYIDNSDDARGYAGWSAVAALRAQVWNAIVFWRVTEDYEPIEYTGGHLQNMDRARLYYQLEFSMGSAITRSEVYSPEDDLDDLVAAGIRVDVVNPMVDTNIMQGADGPDGRIEFIVDADVTAS